VLGTARTLLLSGAMLAMVATLSAARPMRVIVLVDTSAATSSAMPQIRTAVASLIEALPGEHEIALVTTGRHAQVRVQPTADRAKLKSSAAGLTTDGGPTALMDALREMDDRFLRKPADRWGVFVVITGDGSENSKDTDTVTFNTFLADINRRGVLANAIVLKTTGTGLPEVIATSIVKATGGHYAVMSSGGGITDAATTLAGQLATDAARRP